jgi:hypothetical protein
MTGRDDALHGVDAGGTADDQEIQGATYSGGVGVLIAGENNTILTV